MLRTLRGAAIACLIVIVSTTAAAARPHQARPHQAAPALVYCDRDASYRVTCGSPAAAVRQQARYKRVPATLDANGNRQSRAPRLSPATRSLVALINWKLARWVHPTGKCFGASEQLATYYWQGRRTATGERFNPHGLTAASRHLPFGTRLTITNPHNGRSVEVVINDRGPYTDADIDLALGAARALGLTSSSYVCVVGG